MQTECPSRCAHPLNKQESLAPRKCTPAASYGTFTLLVTARIQLAGMEKGAEASAMGLANR
ncbi:hypothetical protein ABTF25_20005, partial [Acinetobacter baumannii]